jgi:hypothetical protein
MGGPFMVVIDHFARSVTAHLDPAAPFAAARKHRATPSQYEPYGGRPDGGARGAAELGQNGRHPADGIRALDDILCTRTIPANVGYSVFLPGRASGIELPFSEQNWTADLAVVAPVFRPGRFCSGCVAHSHLRQRRKGAQCLMDRSLADANPDCSGIRHKTGLSTAFEFRIPGGEHSADMIR